MMKFDFYANFALSRIIFRIASINIKQSNERLKQENECLNYDDGSEYRTQNKITTLEDYNNGLIELTKISKRRSNKRLK